MMQIEPIFLKIVNMSITAGYCIVIVLLLRWFIRKLPKIYSYVLWTAVYFRLVCPVLPQSTLSLIRMKTEPIPQNTGTQILPHVSTGTALPDQAVKHVIQGNVLSMDTATGVDPMQIIISAAGIVWITVCCLLLACSAWSYIRLHMRLRNARFLEDGVYEKEGIETPFVIGLRRPKIFLPPGMEERDKVFVLEHERTHIRRRDHLVKQAAFFISCVHWFHPLVWLSFSLMCRDMEMSCDECVIRKMGKDVRKEYSAALLSLSSGRKVVLGSPLAFGENSIRSRIVNVLRYKKCAVWVSLVMVVLIAAVTVGLALNPEDDVQGNRAADRERHAGQGVSAQTPNKQTPTKLKNIILASSVMPLSDGTEVTVELCMANGIFYEDTMEDKYGPSIYSQNYKENYTYRQNYEGNYIVRTKNREGEVLYQNGLEHYWKNAGVYFEGGIGFNYPGTFPLVWTDYNADGCPDFTIGLPVSSSNMGFALLTVREDGKIDPLCSEEIVNADGVGEFSVILDHDTQADQMPIFGYLYDNTVRKTRPVKYLYNGQNGRYEREPDEIAKE